MITIRDYQDKDWAAICAIHDAARPDELKDSCDPRGFIPIEQDREVEDLRRAIKWVAEEAGEVLAFVGIDGNYLAWLYVQPAHYRRGLGRLLLRHALEAISPGAWTIVLDGNHSAIQLYQSEGFREVRRFESDNNGYPGTCLRLERS